jgi:HEAT repeat protein
MARVQRDVDRGNYRAALQCYEADGRSDSVLRALSQRLLLSAARSTEAAQRRGAFVELAMLGTRAEGLLQDLSAPGEPPLVRAEALRLRSSLGDEDAREELRGMLGHPDPEVEDCAYAALRPGADDAQLLAALQSARAARRSQALQLLSRAPARYLTALSEVGRFDPLPQLRAAAMRSLPSYGAAAAPALEAGASDTDEQVRSAALEGLLRVASERAWPLLDQQLGAAVSVQSIAAATTLLSMPQTPARERAYAAWLAALSASDTKLRAQAASVARPVTLDLQVRELMRERLDAETEPAIRLALALALGADDAAARRALVELSSGASVVAAQAAAELAQGSEQARARLRSLGTHESALVRATSARLMARTLAEVGPIAPLLADENWQVREAAAGAVLNVL